MPYVPPYCRRRALSPFGWIFLFALAFVAIVIGIFDIDAIYFWNHGP